MAKKRKKEEEEIVNLSKAEQIIEKNYKTIILAVVAIVAIAGIWSFINHSGSGKEAKAQTAAVGAQDFFNQQQWQAAIDGDENTVGFTEISSKYKGTHIGNLANYYVGVSYMKTGEFEKAIDALSKYSSTKDPNINGLVEMNLGDANMELDNKEVAVKHYKKASEVKSEAYQADFMLRYAMAQFKVNDMSGAKTTFQKISKEFPSTTPANTADQYLAGL